MKAKNNKLIIFRFLSLLSSIMFLLYISNKLYLLLNNGHGLSFIIKDVMNILDTIFFTFIIVCNLLALCNSKNYIKLTRVLRVGLKVSIVFVATSVIYSIFNVIVSRVNVRINLFVNLIYLFLNPYIIWYFLWYKYFNNMK